MLVSLPIYVKQSVEDGSILARHLFVEDLWAAAKETHQAIDKLVTQFRSLVSHTTADNEEMKQLLVHPVDWQERQIKVQLSLKRTTLKGGVTLILTECGIRTFAFMPEEPDFWFEIKRHESLTQQVCEILATHYRQVEKDEGLDDIRSRLENRGQTWTTVVDVHVTPKKRKWGESTSINPLSMLTGGRSFDGSEELNKVGRCLDSLYPNGLMHAIEREDEIKELSHLLSSRDHPPVLLVGPSKVGKTALLHEWLRRRLANRTDEVAKRNQGKVWLLSPQRLIAGMSYVGEWEERLLAILREAKKRHHILYFDDLVGLFKAGQSSSSLLSAGQVLKPILERREVKVIGEMTFEAFRVLQERDRAFADLFQVIRIQEHDEPQTMRCLISVARRLEQAHQCVFDVEALPTVYRMLAHFVRGQAFPGKAAVFLERLAARTTMTEEIESALTRLGQQSDLDEPTRSPRDVLECFHEQTGLSMLLIDPAVRLPHRQIVASLASRVIGQQEALHAMANAISLAKSCLNDPGKPLGNFLFAGPTGVGKTECAKALAHFMLGDERKLVRFDMNEFIGYDAVSRLVGTFYSPEGLLTSAVRRDPFSIILLDEIEKANRDVYPLLLQVLGEGRLTDALGRVADFSNSIIILTTNLGSKESSRQFGFTQSAQERSARYLEAIEAFFAPEFVNRLDYIVPFRALSREEVAQVANLQIQKVVNREGLARRRCLLTLTASALDLIVEHGFLPDLGARALKRAIETHITRPLAARLSALPVGPVTIIRVDAKNGELDVQASQLREAQTGRVIIEQTYLKQPESLLGPVAAFLARIEDEIQEFAPDGAISTDEVGDEVALYFLVIDLCHKVHNWCQDLEHDLRPDPRRGNLPLHGRQALPLADIRRTTGYTQDLLTPILKAGELARFEKAVTLEDRLEVHRLERRTRAIMRECACIHALNEALFEGQSLRHVLLLRCVGSHDNSQHLNTILDLYQNLVSSLHMTYDVLDSSVLSHHATALLIHGPQANTLLSQETGIQVVLDHGKSSLIQVNVLPVPSDEEWYDVVQEQLHLLDQQIPDVHRVMTTDPRGICDFKADVVALTPPDRTLLRRLALAALPIPPECLENPS